MKHGKGKWKKDEANPKCNQYTGDYFNDKKHGHGQFHWESGNYYVGNYFNDLRHGYGEMYWTDGSYYKGDWEMGVQHGLGEIQLVNGQVKKGIFENNAYKGKAEGDDAVEKPEPLKKKPMNTIDEEDLEEDMNRSQRSPLSSKL